MPQPSVRAGLPLRALFRQRFDGDQALLELARLRFAQAGLAAELYADTPEQLGHVLGFAPPEAPVVHLDRGIDLLQPAGRAAVDAFAERFAGRVWGLVVHDRRGMAERTGELVAAMDRYAGGYAGRPSRPWLFLEYAASHDLGWFAELAERLTPVERVSVCVDVGHIGVKLAHDAFASAHPGLDLATMDAADPRLPGLVNDLQDAVAAALPAVLELAGRLGPIGKPVHFHLHDAHPLVPGLPDHFSFLMRVPIPFAYQGAASLAPLYGPAGLAAILRAAGRSCGPDRLSVTLEIHQAEGRLPLGDAAGLFGHWRDLANAERTNYWLAVMADNAILARGALDGAFDGA